MEKYGLPDFEDLKTSTRTVMVYTNISFDHNPSFKNIEITKVDVPLTKKKKNVDKRLLRAPYGAIISIQLGDKLRGINLRRSKTWWCCICQPMKETQDRLGVQSKKKINTVVEKLCFEDDSDIQTFKYFCERCKKFYNRKELDGIIPHFLNQMTVVLSIGDIILNIMLFKNSFKIAGCKKDDDAVEVSMILWQNHIRPVLNSFKTPNGEDPRFLFLLVMRNVDFRLGWPIDRQKLNKLMNDSRYSDRISMSQCETTSHTNVNIKMFSKKPKGFDYDCLVIPIDVKKEPYFVKMNKNPYKSKKKKKKKYITFIVFSSSEVILSGRYEKNMKEAYEFFVAEVFKNKSAIEEKIEVPTVDLLTHLKANDAKSKKESSG